MRRLSFNCPIWVLWTYTTWHRQGLLFGRAMFVVLNIPDDRLVSNLGFQAGFLRLFGVIKASCDLIRRLRALASLNNANGFTHSFTCRNIVVITACCASDVRMP